MSSSLKLRTLFHRFGLMSSVIEIGYRNIGSLQQKLNYKYKKVICTMKRTLRNFKCSKLKLDCTILIVRIKEKMFFFSRAYFSNYVVVDRIHNFGIRPNPNPKNHRIRILVEIFHKKRKVSDLQNISRINFQSNIRI